MKHLRKLMAMFIAMMMSITMSGTALADPVTPVTHTITIQNTNTAISINGKQYSAYKLFDSSHTTSEYAYYLRTNNQFYTKPAAKTIVEKYFTLNELAGDTSKVSAIAKSDFDARKFADEIQGVLESLTADFTSPAAANETAVIALPNDEAGQGYYIVTGTAKASDQNATDGMEEVTSAVIVTNEDPNPVANPKAGIPTLDKKITAVAEGTTKVEGAVLDTAGAAAVAKIGSTVSYELDSIVPNLTGYTDYTFKFGDTISAGLDYVKTSFTLKINGTVVNIAPVFKTGDKSFTLQIPFNTLKTYTANDPIVLTYDCTVNNSALSTDYENNTANLEYSHNPYDDDDTDTTPDKKTYVIDLNIDVDKVAENASGKKLDGAEFQLYRMNGSNKQYYKWDTTNNKVSWVASDGDAFTTGADGKLTQQVRGLDKGTYYLVETKAPTGYNLLTDPVEIVITVTESGNNVTYTATVGAATATVNNGAVDLNAAQTAAQPVAVAKIVNNAGTQLPSTGGIGTTIFYIVGGIMVAGAVVFLLTKRRMAGNE
jgi:fimbrial isopeptide formation D2 family protein/LPXTG-motif cell wall-anchored protein